MSLYLVTGGAGFIGSHVIESLVEKNEKVRVFDNFSTGKKENLYQFGDGVEVMEGDVRDAAACRHAMKNIKYAIHLAALHEVPRSVEQPLETHEINVTGILNALIAAKDAKVKRFVYASSSAVYGDSPVLPRTEETVSPVSSPYAASKMAGEHYCRLFSSLYGLETVTLRYFNVYGPRQDAASQYAGVIPKFVSALISDAAPTIYGDGEQSRDFLYVKDCAGATLAACHKEGISGEVMNIGTGQQTTVNQLCVLLQRILDKHIPPVFGPPQPGDIRYDYADVSKAKSILSYQPSWDIYRGLEKTAEWYASCFAGSGK
jgi:nucleoside-diphosphate-sugar epimerase